MYPVGVLYVLLLHIFLETLIMLLDLMVGMVSLWEVFIRNRI